MEYCLLDEDGFVGEFLFVVHEFERNVVDELVLNLDGVGFKKRVSFVLSHDITGVKFNVIAYLCWRRVTLILMCSFLLGLMADLLTMIFRRTSSIFILIIENIIKQD